MHYRLGLLLLSVGLCVGLVVVTSPLRARISSASILRMLDKDNDGTVDMAEAKNAGTLLFEQLDSIRMELWMPTSCVAGSPSRKSRQPIPIIKTL